MKGLGLLVEEVLEHGKDHGGVEVCGVVKSRKNQAQTLNHTQSENVWLGHLQCGNPCASLAVQHQRWILTHSHQHVCTEHANGMYM